MNNPLVEKVEPARARGTTTRASRARRCAAAAQLAACASVLRAFGRSAAARSTDRASGAVVNLTTLNGGFFGRGRKQTKCQHRA
jgi:hypothetical protein